MVFLDDIHAEPKPEEYVAAPVSKGSLVLIHGLVHHKSGMFYTRQIFIYTFLRTKFVGKVQMDLYISHD